MMNEQVKKLLEIIGTEDGSVCGKEGRVELIGALGDAVLDETDWAPADIAHCKGKPVKISRYGRLELWCHGFYIEYRDIRPMIYKALRKLEIDTNTVPAQ